VRTQDHGIFLVAVANNDLPTQAADASRPDEKNLITANRSRVHKSGYVLVEFDDESKPLGAWLNTDRRKPIAGSSL
jgi:hypothetical protein